MMSKVNGKQFIGGLVLGFLIAIALTQLGHLTLLDNNGGNDAYTINILEDKAYYSTAIDLIKRANKSIDIIMFVIKYDPGDQDDPANDLLYQLVKASQRGVNVRVLVDDTTLKSYPQTIEYLKKSGIEVKLDESSSKITHAKVIIIDGKIVIIGSHNWTESALKYNHEVSILIKSLGISKTLEDYFNYLWSIGRSAIVS